MQLSYRLLQRFVLNHLLLNNLHIELYSPSSIDNEDLCVPPHEYALKPLYLLARSVIVRHLKCNLPKTHPEIEIHGFSSVDDPIFGQYLESSGIYFVMCHDGALTTIESEKLHSVVGTVDPDWQKIALRKMIRHFIRSGFNVALVNGLEVRDTKVCEDSLTRRMCTLCCLTYLSSIEGDGYDCGRKAQRCSGVEKNQANS